MKKLAVSPPGHRPPLGFPDSTHTLEPLGRTIACTGTGLTNDGSEVDEGPRLRGGAA